MASSPCKLREGIRYTRDGQLTLDSQGRLQTTTGFLVLGTNGKPITIGDPNAVSVGADGTVRSGTATLAGQIDVVSLTGAVKQGDTLVHRHARCQAGGHAGSSRATSRARASSRLVPWST